MKAGFTGDDTAERNDFGTHSQPVSVTDVSSARLPFEFTADPLPLTAQRGKCGDPRSVRFLDVRQDPGLIQKRLLG